MKRCMGCKQTKPSECFSKSKNERDGLYHYCKQCSAKKAREWYSNNKEKVSQWAKANRSKIREVKKKYKEEHPEKIKLATRECNLKKKFGITLDEYEALHIRQNGLCGICGLPETARFRGKVKNLAVDHCHKTSKVRGLLCQSCNTALGGTKDSIEILKKMIRYLMEY